MRKVIALFALLALGAVGIFAGPLTTINTTNDDETMRGSPPTTSTSTAADNATASGHETAMTANSYNGVSATARDGTDAAYKTITTINTTGDDLTITGDNAYIYTIRPPITAAASMSVNEATTRPNTTTSPPAITAINVKFYEPTLTITVNPRNKATVA